MGKIALKSIEDASVIRKFSVLFTLMSVFPFVILAVLFFIFEKGGLRINSDIFFWVVFLVGIFSFIGFVGIRRTLTKLNKLSQNLTGILKGEPPKAIEIKSKGDNEITQIALTFNNMVRKLEDNIKELERSKSIVQDLLTKVASGVSFADNINAFLDLILRTVISALGAKIGLLLLIDNNELIIKSSYGVSDPFYAKDKRIPKDTEVVDWVIKQKKPLLIPRLSKISTAKTEDINLVFQPPLICVPLIYQNKVTGAVLISNKEKEANFEEDEVIILSNISSQIALAIDNAKLNSDAERTYIETITALALAVEARDVYSRGHSDRVVGYGVKIAQKLGLSQEQIKTVKEAAQLHDVGKIGINDSILLKSYDLNDYEKQIMQQHPIIGEGIIAPLHGFLSLREPVRHHHQWVNGEGYPDHLKGDEISIEARILSVADSFDAMTTDRPYRKGMNFEEAKQELNKYKGIRYDAKVVDTFLNCI